MKKLLIAQMSLLVLVIIIGALLKNDLSAHALRSAHKIIGGLAVIVGIVSIIKAFISKSKDVVKVLLLIALLSTMLAGAAGKSTVSGKNYTSSFNRMRLFAVVSLATTTGALLIQGKPTAKQEQDSQTAVEN